MHAAEEVKPNKPVPLGREAGQLIAGANSFSGEFELSYSLVPKPRVVVSGELVPEGHPFEFFGTFFENDPVSLRLASTGDTVDLIVTSFSVGQTSNFEAFVSSGLWASGSKLAVHKIRFHLMNFPDYLVQQDGQLYQNSVSMQDTQFRVTLEGAPGIKETVECLKREGGYGATHICEITRLDGQPITYADATSLLRQLHHFFAFCWGGWPGVFLPTGCDAAGTPVWQEYSNRLMDPWGFRMSWLDRHNCQAMVQAYTGFAAKWADPEWQPILERALYWYLRSNGPSGGTDGAIILTQAALEYLAWAYLVESTCSLSQQGFERLSASDSLRILLHSLDIPLHVPPTLTRLGAMGSAFDWDGPAAFVEIRNNIVHPGRKKGRLKNEKVPYFETWNLGQWYLELILLRVMDFHGVHQPRIRQRGWVGDVWQMPWDGEIGGLTPTA